MIRKVTFLTPIVGGHVSNLWVRGHVNSPSQKGHVRRIARWVFPKIWENPQIIHLFIGFSTIFTIHFGVPLFLETPIYIYRWYFYNIHTCIYIYIYNYVYWCILRERGSKVLQILLVKWGVQRWQRKNYDARETNKFLAGLPKFHYHDIISDFAGKSLLHAVQHFMSGSLRNGCFQPYGKNTKSSHLFIGFGTIIFTIHFGGFFFLPLFLVQHPKYREPPVPNSASFFHVTSFFGGPGGELITPRLDVGDQPRHMISWCLSFSCLVLYLTAFFPWAHYNVMLPSMSSARHMISFVCYLVWLCLCMQWSWWFYISLLAV